MSHGELRGRVRRPINIIDCSPLSFFKMLRTSSANVRLMFVLLLQVRHDPSGRL